jgi:hypothetical protein
MGIGIGISEPQSEYDDYTRLLTFHQALAAQSRPLILFPRLRSRTKQLQCVKPSIAGVTDWYQEAAWKKSVEQLLTAGYVCREVELWLISLRVNKSNLLTRPRASCKLALDPFAAKGPNVDKTPSSSKTQERMLSLNEDTTGRQRDTQSHSLKRTVRGMHQEHPSSDNLFSHLVTKVRLFDIFLPHICLRNFSNEQCLTSTFLYFLVMQTMFPSLWILEFPIHRNDVL